VTGWLDDRSQTYWGRPVDVKPANDGSLLISDDESGTIYRLMPLSSR
jgi:glucose/arabinose dehydrogenase